MRLSASELYISKKVGKAMADYKMLSEGDRIAIGVSGGKDSMTLLHILQTRQNFCPIKYHLVAVHVDLGYYPKDTRRLKNYLKKSRFEYAIKKLDISPKDKNCFWCSWNRRKILFETAAEYNCSKVALGHNMDDIIQTVLLNLFFNSEISAMSPNQELFGGRLRVIRPLAYVEKNRITSFVKESKIPFYKYSCRKSYKSNRKKIADIIEDLRKICPDIKTNIFRSIKRIKKDYLL